MLDTIEMLETIGRDASLRYASTEELTNIPEQAQASEILTAAVATSDTSRLTADLWPWPMQPPQSTQTVPDSENG